MRSLDGLHRSFQFCKLTDGSGLSSRIVGNDDEPPAAPAAVGLRAGGWTFADAKALLS